MMKSVFKAFFLVGFQFLKGFSYQIIGEIVDCLFLNLQKIRLISIPSGKMVISESKRLSIIEYFKNKIGKNEI